MPIYSYVYSIPYLLIALVLLFLYKKEMIAINRMENPKNFRNLSFVIMLVFIGLRGHLHTDFTNYYPYFEEIPSLLNWDLLLWSNFVPRFEPGFVVYTSLCKSLLNNYFAWVFINTLIDFLVFRCVFRKFCVSEILPFFFFLVYHGLALEFNYYRTAKSFDLFLLSIPFLLEKRFWPYLILNAIGVLFHYGSFVYILLYPILIRRITMRMILLIFVLVNILYWSGVRFTTILVSVVGEIGNDIILNKLVGYQDWGLAYKFSFGYFEKSFSLLLVMLLYDRLCSQNKNNYLIVNCLVIYYCVNLIFADVYVFAERFSLLFAFSYWIIYTNIFSLRFSIKSYVVLFVILLSIAKISIGCANITNYYDNIIWGVMDYNERYFNKEAWKGSRL